MLCLHDTITPCYITVGQSLMLVKTDIFVCNQVKNSGSFHLTACTLFSKIVCLCFPIDDKHCIGWYCTSFIYGYVYIYGYLIIYL